MPITVGTKKRTTKRTRGRRTASRVKLSPTALAVDRYIEGVLNGTVIAGELVRLAVKRHLLDLQKGKKRGLWFDEQKAVDAIEFFSYLKHSKGEWAGQSFKLEPWQMFILWVVFGWIKKDGTRRFRTAYLEVARKNGKALDIDTPIPTPSGWVKMGDITPGDLVFDDTGAICRVTGATDVMTGRPCYAVKFSDGSTIVADAEHEWMTDSRRTGRPYGAALTGIPRHAWKVSDRDRIHTTIELQKTLLVDSPRYRASKKRECNHRIGVAGALNIQPAALPIPPYVLGAWLGDGHSASARLTCGYGDLQIVDTIRADWISAVEQPSPNANSGVFILGSGGRSQKNRAESMQGRLRALGVLNNKHIPMQYRRAGYDQRLALLQGLMDTDGYVSGAGQCEFTTTSRSLHEGMIDLLCGLGFKPSTKIARAMLNGRDCGPKYRIQFWAFGDRPVFRLARKKARLKDKPSRLTRSSFRQIIEVHQIESVPVRCIEVDSPSHLYLAGPTMIPTHNSTLGGGVGLKLAFADDEPGAEVYSAATKQDQAIITHGEATRMVRASPDLADVIQIFKNSLTRTDRAQKYEPLGADEHTLDGLNVHGAIIDELHAHKTRGVYDLMDTATGARRQPLLFAITTAGVDQSDGSICWEQHVYAEQILRGIIDDDNYFAFVCALDDKDDWQDERNWYKANPNLGVSKKLDYMRDQAKKAAKMPGFLNTFLRLDLNRWTQQVTRWLDMGEWTANTGAPIDEPALHGQPCYGGLDLSSVSDLTAFVLLFPETSPGVASVLCRFWCPESRLMDEHNRYRDQYQSWARDGWLTTTPGNAIDYEAVKAKVLQDAQTFQLAELAVDRLFQGYQMSMQLAEEGITVAACGMGFMSMAGPTAELERRLLSRGLRHGGNPVLRWMANNVSVKQDPAGNKKPDKSSSQGKIDGIVALLLALDRDMRHQTQASIYETRGFLTLGGPTDAETETT